MERARFESPFYLTFLVKATCLIQHEEALLSIMKSNQIISFEELKRMGLKPTSSGQRGRNLSTLSTSFLGKMDQKVETLAYLKRIFLNMK